MNAENARQRAKEAACEADRAEAYAWWLRMEGFGGPAQPSPTIGQCSTAAMIKCNRRSIPLDAVRISRATR
jgi:hypothetical protein